MDFKISRICVVILGVTRFKTLLNIEFPHAEVKLPNIFEFGRLLLLWK